MDFERKVVLVTGANRGIGKSIANQFINKGATTIVNYPNCQMYPDWVDAHTNGIPYKCDVSCVEQIKNMFHFIKAEYKKVDVLINNAAVFPKTPMEDIDDIEWCNVMNTNVKGPFFCSQLSSKLLIQNQARGKIINIASDAASKGSKKGVHYSASKGALISMTRSMARVLGKYGITVNAIAPGVVDTLQPNLNELQKQEKGKEIPLGRIGNVDDIANVVLMISSDYANYITGETIYVNGGAYLSG